MDISQLDEVDKSSPETFSDSSLSSDSPHSNDIYGEPLVHPRVGDEYQVEIPSILNKSELQQLMNSADSEGVIDSSRSFLMGLPMPVMWICNEGDLTKGRVEALNNPHAICTNGLVESGNNVGMNNVSSAKEEPNVKVDASNQTYCLVPGESSAPWSDIETGCFLLGLYIFGKNLLQVMRFMESKEIGKILAYYYGWFYGSSEYRKWSECRKMRNKKCVPGHRFFTGYRQHELFARLSPRLSEESKTKFLEVSKAFIEGRTYLEDYVSSLKALVGIHALVYAVGIGKGKDDLTTLILDSTRNNQLFTHRPEIPSGKAFSSLTCAEIVKFLTGDFRLSKARSNDLFWEAVWPRLLARGWHSEQPSDDNYAGSKNCLVFLMPGISKFSRRKLSKGDHYFDSVSDLLTKVSSEPQLLELDADETAPSSSKVENGWAVDVKLDDDLDLSNRERHSYLKPRVSSDIVNLFEFTVVDTSLANEANSFKVRELRSLPLEAKRCSSSRKPKKLSVRADTTENGLKISTKLSHSKGFTSADGSSVRMPGSPDLPLKKSRDDNLPKDHKPRTIKLKFTRRSKPGLTSCSSGQVTKRRRIVSCGETELSLVLCLPARTDETENSTKNVAAFKSMTNNAVPSGARQSDDPKVSSTRTLVGGSSIEKTLVDKSLTDLSSFVSLAKENLAQEVNVIDLNLPHVQTESDGMIKLEIKPESDDKAKLEVKIEGKVKLEGMESSVFQQPESMNPEHSDVKDHLVSCTTVEPTNKGGDMLDQQQPRRQSTRNRPLTTKALEALEIGFLSPVKHSRKRPPSTLKEQKSKCPAQLRIKSSMLSPAVDFEVREAADKNINEKMSKISVDKAAMPPDLLGLTEASFAPTTSSKEMFT